MCPGITGPRHPQEEGGKTYSRALDQHRVELQAPLNALSETGAHLKLQTGPPLEPSNSSQTARGWDSTRSGHVPLCLPSLRKAVQTNLYFTEN